MSAALLGNWSLFGVLSVAVLARLIDEFGKRTMTMGPVAMLGAVMFIVSTLCMNAWKFSDDLPSQLSLWRWGLFADALLYLGIYAWLKGRVELVVSAIPAALFLHIVALSEVNIGSAQIVELGQISLIALLCVLCFRKVESADLVGLLFWGTLALNEAVSAAHVLDCQFAHGMFGTREVGSACAQVYGFDPTVFTFALGSMMWAYFLVKWFRPR